MKRPSICPIFTNRRANDLKDIVAVAAYCATENNKNTQQCNVCNFNLLTAYRIEISHFADGAARARHPSRPREQTRHVSHAHFFLLPKPHLGNRANCTFQTISRPSKIPRCGFPFWEPDGPAAVRKFKNVTRKFSRVWHVTSICTYTCTKIIYFSSRPERSRNRGPIIVYASVSLALVWLRAQILYLVGALAEHIWRSRLEGAGRGAGVRIVVLPKINFAFAARGDSD